MLGSQAVTTEITQLNGLKTLVETYQTIAVSSARRIRDSVLLNRAFYGGLNRIAREVRSSWRRELAGPIGGRKNGKTVGVLLSANTGLYGEIIDKTLRLFLGELGRTEKSDVVIVGRMGRLAFEGVRPALKFSYFDFPDDRFSPEMLRPLIGRIAQYEKVVVFHGAFENLLVQHPAISEITSSRDTGKEDALPQIRYLFEPSLHEVARFFEREIFASLLEQTFQESRLAKLTSRMVLLDRAAGNIDGATTGALFREKRLRHHAFNKKQLDALRGLSLWGRSNL